jgi:hypothetical protein
LPFVPKRPEALAHLNDVDAAIALSRSYGDVVVAAKALGVSAPDLRQLTRHNPQILEAASDRVQFFILSQRCTLMRGLRHPSRRVQARAMDLIGQFTSVPGHPLSFGAPDSELAYWAPVARKTKRGPRQRSTLAFEAGEKAAAAAERERLAYEQEVAAENARYAEQEQEYERRREQEAERRRELEAAAEDAGVDVIERDGRSISVPRYGGGRVDDCVERGVSKPHLLDGPAEPSIEYDPVEGVEEHELIATGYELKQLDAQQYNRVAVALLEAPWARQAILAQAEHNGFDVSQFR